MDYVIYLDYNCFQRGFDDPNQIRIQMEALACQEIFTRAEKGEIRLVWSFMHEDETILCPFPERRDAAFRLAKLCKIKLEPVEAIRNRAHIFQRKGKLRDKDSLHLACAVEAKADYFLSCINPVDFVRQEINK